MSFLYIYLMHIDGEGEPESSRKKTILFVLRENQQFSHFLMPLFQSQMSAWWMGEIRAKGFWKSFTMVPGGQCVMMTGTSLMPEWCATNSDVAVLSPWQEICPLAGERGLFCWTMWTAKGRSHHWSTVLAWGGLSTTATITKMWPSCAMVQILIFILDLRNTHSYFGPIWSGEHDLLLHRT